MSRAKIQLGRIGSMRNMIAQAKKGREFSIVLTGWRKKALVPSLLQSMPKARLKNIDVTMVNKWQLSKWSPKNIWLGFWLGPIVSLYELTIEDGKDVLIVGGHCIEIIFGTVGKRKGNKGADHV